MNTSTLPVENPKSVDQLPIRALMGRSADTITARLQKYGLTAESLNQDGASLAELALPYFRRFHFTDHRFGGQNSKLSALLDTTKDPKSTASVWLRAILEQPSDTLTREEQFSLLNDALNDKLDIPTDNPDPYWGLKWSTLALRGAKAVCHETNLTESEQVAVGHLVGKAFSSFPDTMIFKGNHLMLSREDESKLRLYSVATNWSYIKIHFLDIAKRLDPELAMPAGMLPFQLSMIDAFDDYTLEDEMIARKNDGLCPFSMIGHRSFQVALQRGTHWPHDPHNDALLAWHQEHNPLLAARVKPLIDALTLENKTILATRQASKVRL